MRLTLRLDGRPPPDLEPEMEFGISGGTIGRASSNSWVLRDPDRTISARHLVIGAANGRFFAVDTSSNGVLYNGSRPVGRGNRVQLDDGDSLTVGPYRLIASIPDDGDGLGRRRSEAVSTLGADPGPGTPSPRIDPLAGLGGEQGPAPRSIIPDDFDPLGPVEPRRPVRPAPVPVRPAIPDDLPLPRRLPEAFEAAEPPRRDVDFQDGAAEARLEAALVLPSPDGGDIGAPVLLPVARRSSPLLLADGAALPVLLALWKGLGLGPVPGAERAAEAAAVGAAIAAILDRGLGRGWRALAATGDAAALERLADQVEAEEEAVGS